tara:strand:+ start:53 stop:760 length:708 start_codon:yes stop_codon:yes gene_type:complete
MNIGNSSHLRESTVQLVQRRIAAMIRNGDLVPGQKLPSQRGFSEQLQVSRATLREGLMRLETLGLLRTEPARGTFVTDPKDARRDEKLPWRFSERYMASDVFQARFVLESEIAAAAALHISTHDMAALTQATNQMETAWKRGDIVANVEADVQFHSIIVASCPNVFMQDIYASVRAQVVETQMQAIPATEASRMKASLSEHRAVIVALSRRDAEEARREMRAHIRNTALCAGLQI